MRDVFQVTFKDIESLTDIQLTELLDKLLTLEALRFPIPLRNVAVPLRITVPDGGNDGRIEWSDGPAETDFIPNRFTIFQVKATPMSKQQFAAELNIRRTSELRNAIKQVIDKGGSYVFFYGRSCNDDRKDIRYKAMRERLSKCGVDTPKDVALYIYAAEDITRWTNQFPVAVADVLTKCGKPVPHGIMTWEKWGTYPGNQGTFHSNDKLENYINRIQSTAAIENSVIRIEGLSGLGKTRLAFEALRPAKKSENHFQSALSLKVVHFDASQGNEQVHFAVQSLIDREMHAILVVDECRLDLHETLEKQIKRSDSKLSLITIDHDLSSTPRPEWIQLQPADQTDVVKAILADSYPQLSDSDRSRIAEMAQGYPVLARLFAKAQLDPKDTHIGRIDDKRLLQKILWGRGQENEEVYQVLSACALFTHIGYEDELINQRNFVAEEIAATTTEKLYKICRRYIQEHRIIQRRGRYIRLEPRPLALALAAEWWKNTPPELIQTYISKIIPTKLCEPFFRQLKMLDYVPEVRSAVEDLCGESGIFKAEYSLNTERGETLVHHLCEVNPRATMNLLNRVCSSWTVEQWTPGSYSLPRFYWTLQNLCWWEETFAEASTLLLNSISHDTGSNLTQQESSFTECFRVRLPGTQCPLAKRLQVLEKALDSEHKEKRGLAVKALGSALTTGSVSRTGGMERQGSRKEGVDYSPETWQEVNDYWKICIDLLAGSIEADDELSSLALSQFGVQLGGLIRPEMMEYLDSVIRRIASHVKGYWPDAVASLNHFVEFHDSNLSSDVSDAVRDWVTLLSPSNVVDKIKLIVDIPDWGKVKNVEGEWVDIAAQEATSLAGELHKEGFDWGEHADILLKGENQRQAWPFGAELARLSSDGEALLGSILDELKGRHRNETNLNFVFGVLQGVAETDAHKKFLDRLVSNNAVSTFVIPLLRYSKPEKSHFDTLLDLIRAGEVPVQDLYLWLYGNILESLPKEDRLWFVGQVSALANTGKVAALGFVMSHCHQNDECFKMFADLVREIAMTRGLYLVAKEIDSQSLASPYRAARRLLRTTNDPELAKFVCDDVIYSVENYSGSLTFDYEVQRTIEVLFRLYPTESWEVFGAYLLKKDQRGQQELIWIIGPERIINSGSPLVEILPEQLLQDWCVDNQVEGAKVISDLVTLIDETGKWTSWTGFLLEKFGDVTEVLNAMDINIMPTSATGSWVPQYEARAKSLMELATHSNPNVAKWARDLAEDYRNKAKSERSGDDERDLRYE